MPNVRSIAHSGSCADILPGDRALVAFGFRPRTPGGYAVECACRKGTRQLDGEGNGSQSRYVEA